MNLDWLADGTVAPLFKILESSSTSMAPAEINKIMTALPGLEQVSDDIEKDGTTTLPELDEEM